MERGKSRRGRQRREIKNEGCVLDVRCGADGPALFLSSFGLWKFPALTLSRWKCAYGKSRTAVSLSNVHILQLANDKFKPRHLVWHHSTKMYTAHSQFFVSRYLSINRKLSCFACRCCSNITGKSDSMHFLQRNSGLFLSSGDCDFRLGFRVAESSCLNHTTPAVKLPNKTIELIVCFGVGDIQ